MWVVMMGWGSDPGTADYFSMFSDARRSMVTPAVSSPTTPSESAISESIRTTDAMVVAEQVFEDFSLSDAELQRASEVLWTMSGGEEYQRILVRARKKAAASWESVASFQREQMIKSVMSFHCSAADMERMALRTGAGLMLLGERDLGEKIVENAPVAQFGVKPLGTGVWLRIGQLFLYVFMLSLIAIQSAVTGVYLFVIPGAIVFVIALVLVWLLERNKWKLEHEQREAKNYVLALTRLAQGVPLDQLFAPDGSLRTPLS
jgi:hypothetical protein